jgi:membrane fusion protein (multidrug efflux system)
MSTEAIGSAPAENPPAAKETKAAEAPAKSSPPATAPAPKKSGLLRLIIIGIVVLAVLALGIPMVLHSMETVSTDDAYVNSYVTFVAPRVPGQVLKVLVDDNYRVKKDDVLVEIDPEPYQVALEIKQAALDKAKADLVAAQANTRAQIAQARSDRFKLVHAIEDVDDQIAIIRQRAAAYQQAQASEVLAQADFDRDDALVKKNAVSVQEYDQRREQLAVAKAQVAESLEEVHQARAVLGLPADPPAGQGLADVPPDLDQNFSSVRQALADLYHSGSQLGVVISSFNLTPNQLLAEFYKRDPSGDIDKIYAKIYDNAPGLKQAQVNVEQAQADVDQANLNLRYCTVHADINGVVTRRNVNPGDYLEVGQDLMALRDLHNVWVDANFKETQLQQLRIGQHVDLYADMYGHHMKFEGRISGFTNGTGSTLALLPAQNATGNFVKVVQRVPVRIDLVNYDPANGPLFVGLSVTPVVDIVSPPTGPNAGKFLQDTSTTPPPE